MPKIPVTQAPAGPALDAAVAEVRGWQSLVMGSNAFWVTYGEHDLWTASGYLSVLPDEGWIEEPLPTYGEKGIWNPSTDIAAAWELVESDNTIYHISVRIKPPCSCELAVHKGVEWASPPKMYDATGETIALAITRAYLKAKGVEEIDMPD